MNDETHGAIACTDCGAPIGGEHMELCRVRLRIERDEALRGFGIGPNEPAGLARYAEVFTREIRECPPRTQDTEGGVCACVSVITAHVRRMLQERLDAKDEALSLREEREDYRKGIAELTAERDEAKFSPLGDNHHNAHRCPYCSPDIVKRENAQIERSREERRRAESAEARCARLERVAEAANSVSTEMAACGGGGASCDNVLRWAYRLTTPLAALAETPAPAQGYHVDPGPPYQSAVFEEVVIDCAHPIEIGGWSPDDTIPSHPEPSPAGELPRLPVEACGECGGTGWIVKPIGAGYKQHDPCPACSKPDAGKDGAG